MHHLFKIDEMLGMQLLTIHNIHYMNKMMEFIRTSINNDRFEEAQKEWFVN